MSPDKFRFSEEDILEGGYEYEAKMSAELGMVKGAEYNLEKAEVSENLRERIMERAYERGIPTKMDISRKFAVSGDVYKMERHLREAEKYSEELGVKIPSTSMKKIRERGYIEAIREDLSEAVEFGRKAIEKEEPRFFGMMHARVMLSNEYLEKMETDRDLSDLKSSMTMAEEVIHERNYDEGLDLVEWSKNLFEKKLGKY